MRDALLRSGRSVETERTRSVRVEKKDPLCHEQERGHREDEPAGGSEGEVGGDSDEFVFEVGWLLLMVDISAPGNGMELRTTDTFCVSFYRKSASHDAMLSRLAAFSETLQTGSG